MQFRPSLYFVNDLKKGSIVTDIDVHIVRPGFGIKPKFFDKVIGKYMQEDVEKHTPVSWEQLRD